MTAVNRPEPPAATACLPVSRPSLVSLRICSADAPGGAGGANQPPARHRAAGMNRFFNLTFWLTLAVAMMAVWADVFIWRP
jgi:hypothetical protein